jgi:hypothetical protein
MSNRSTKLSPKEGYDARPSPNEEYLRVTDVPDAVWLHVRDAICAGVDATIVSNRTGVSERWIEMRATKENWLTPARRELIMKQYQLDDPARLARIKDDLEIAAAALSAEKIIEHRAFVATMASTKMKEGQADIEAPRSWKEMDIADRMARRALGLEDGPQTANVIQIGSLDSLNVEDAPVYNAPVQWDETDPA